MITLSFEGWFQLRMATDPDPTDCKRGLSGYTFALPGEPDFDGILHLQPDEPGVWEREFGPLHAGPSVGVTVRSATRNGMPADDLVGARIAMPEARLVERNGIVVRDDMFPIDPLRVCVTLGDELLAERTDLLDPNEPERSIMDATGDQIRRRQCNGFTRNSFEVAEATGLPGATDESLIRDRENRRKSLVALLDETKHAGQRMALQTRIEQLTILRQWWNLSASDEQGRRPIDRRAYTRGLQAHGWNIDINGPIAVNDLGGDPDQHWPLQFWLGGWDGDALCGYIKGQWIIPLAT